MEIIHLELKEANEYVAQLHRHHKPVIGHRFSIGAMKNGILVGVAIVGRPVARNTDYKKGYGIITPGAIKKSERDCLCPWCGLDIDVSDPAIDIIYSGGLRNQE